MKTVRARAVALLGLLILLASITGCASDAVVEATRATSSATTEPRAAKEALKAAFEKKDKTDERLGRVLGRVGPMIVPAQQRSFVKAFQALPDVHAVAVDYHARASALDTELTRIMSNDAELASVMKGITERVSMGRGTYERTIFGAKDVFDSYTLLAQTPYATGAVKFAVRLLAHDPKLAAVSAQVRDVDTVEKILVPALPGTFLQKLLASGSTYQAKSATSAELLATGDACREVANWISDYKNLKGDLITTNAISVSSVSVGQGLRTIAGIIAIWDLGGNLARGDIDAAIQSFVNGGPAAIAGVASATSLFRRVVMGIEATPLADSILRWSSRIGNGIGLIVNVFTLANDLGKWNDSVEAKVRVAGDVVALGAAILVLAGAGPIGPILGIVALGIHIFADWLEGQAIEEQERRDLAACLPMTGLSQPVIDTMIHADGHMVRTLAEEVKLQPEHLQWLLTVDDWAVRTDVGPPVPVRYIGVQVTQIIFSLDAAETYALLKAVVGNETRPQQMKDMLEAFFRGTEYGFGYMGDMSKAEGLAWMQDEANSEYVRDDQREIWRKTFLNARAYLATK